MPIYPWAALSGTSPVPESLGSPLAPTLPRLSSDIKVLFPVFSVLPALTPSHNHQPLPICSFPHMAHGAHHTQSTFSMATAQSTFCCCQLPMTTRAPSWTRHQEMAKPKLQVEMEVTVSFTPSHHSSSTQSWKSGKRGPLCNLESFHRRTLYRVPVKGSNPRAIRAIIPRWAL